jgi:hypothetical protein
MTLFDPLWIRYLTDLATESVQRSEKKQPTTEQFGYSRDTSLCVMTHKHVYATPLIMRREVGERAIGAGFIILLVA